MIEHKGYVLVVDDDRLNRTLLSHSVKKAGYDVEMATGGQEALTMLSDSDFDIVLLDLLMPDMSGYEVLERMKGDETLRHIPVIVVSNMKEMTNVAECIELGAADHLSKPANPILLKARLNASMATKRLRDAQLAYTDELLTQNQELDAFAQTVAHDLKNPLTGIIGFCEMLGKFDDEKLIEHRANITRVARMGRQMESIIHELLLLASVRKEEVQLQPIDMGAIVQSTLDRLSYTIETYQPEIILPDSWPTAIGYGSWMEEVWANYISNALKYGGKPPRMEFGADTDHNAGMVRFWLRDNGAGIAPEDQVKLFVPFKRFNKARIEGQGLGLSIVQRIAEKLEGQVGMESEQGVGSTFWFALPVANL